MTKIAGSSIRRQGTIDWSRVKKRRVLGAGVFGKVWKVSYDGNIYAMKKQKALRKKVRGQDISVQQELEFFTILKTLSTSNSTFFVKQFGKERWYDDCTHEMIHWIPAKGFDELVSSTTCVEYLMEYKDGPTLTKYLLSGKASDKQIRSFCAQVCHIQSLLHGLGLEHGDLHGKNIIVTQTEQSTFRMDTSIASTDNPKLPFIDGLQLVAIDYGTVSKDKQSKKQLCYDIKRTVVELLTDMFASYEQCVEQSKEKLFDSKKNIYRLLHHVYQEEPTLLHSIMRSIDPALLPACRALLDFCDKHMASKTASPKALLIDMMDDNRDLYKVFWYVENEFLLYKPRLHHMLMKCCSEEPILHAPPSVVRDIMYAASAHELIDIVCSLAST
jgi:tRNA A-37 threonylcarbamoyl transferase component Bud32